MFFFSCLVHGDGFRAAPVEVVCSVADFFFLVSGRKVCVFYCFLQICVCRRQCMRFSIGRRDLELQRLLFLVPLHKLLAAIHLVLVFTFTASATIYECLLVFVYLFLFIILCMLLVFACTRMIVAFHFFFFY